MKAMLFAFVATAAITVAAWYGLTHVIDFTAADRTKSNAAVRLGDSGPEGE